jgi:1-deoxy-D-xylulose-5-phosphate reductoisomerase
VDVPALDLATVGELTFEEPDPDVFACLRLAREAGGAGGTAPCVLNAADEVAVEAFLAERIPFGAIAEVVEEALDQTPPHEPAHFEDLFAADAAARKLAARLVEGHSAALGAS